MGTESFDIFAFFKMVCGLSFFLYGMKFGEKGLRKISGGKLKKIITLLTKNRFYGMITGVVVTFFTQSSSATSVMLVSLTNAGLMALFQSMGMLLGSDIGTTLTVQLYSFNFYELAPIMISAGFFLFAFSNSTSRQKIGQIIMAFGMVFFGMHMMSDSIVPLRDNEIFLSMFRKSLSSAIMAILVAAIFTAVVQSSAATIAMVLGLTAIGSTGGQGMTIEQAIPFIWGANIGTCATAFLASLKTDREAKRVAWAHILFKIFGVALFLPFLKPFASICANTSGDITRQIANAHTIFNVSIALIFLPFTKHFASLINYIIPIRSKTESGYNVEHIDKNVYGIPAVAIEQATRETTRMSNLVIEMAKETINVLKKDKKELRKEIVEQDNYVDFLQEQISPYLCKLSEMELSPEQSQKEMQLLFIITELEQIGDVVSKNIMHHAHKKEKQGFLFSEEGWKEIKELHSISLANIQSAIRAFIQNDMELANKILNGKPQTSKKVEELKQSHIFRLQKGLPETLETTTIHLDLLDDLYLISIHAFRIAKQVLKMDMATNKVN